MKNKRLIWQIPFLLLLIFGSIFVIRQQQNTPYQRDEGFIFGTIYHITYQSDVNYQIEIEAVFFLPVDVMVTDCPFPVVMVESVPSES